MPRSRRRYLGVSYRYPDGVVDGIGSMHSSGSNWSIRYYRIDPQNPGEVDEQIEVAEDSEAALFLYFRWWDEQRKFDADALISSGEQLTKMLDADMRSTLTYGVFDAIVDSMTRASHRALDNGAAPWDWWESEARDYIPPFDFGCRCKLFATLGSHARRLVEAGQAFDLTRKGISLDPPNPLWKRWASCFLSTWDELCGTGISAAEARDRALVEAKKSMLWDKGAIKAALLINE